MSPERTRESSPQSASKEPPPHHTKVLHLLYHELRPAKSEYSYVIETGEFEKHSDLFVRARSEASSMLWPEITFDDGHLSNFEFALPILQSRGLQARFFITVGWTGQKPGYMGWEDLRSLHKAGQFIGAHGWSHTLLTHCSKKDLLTELATARLMLEDKLGTSITTMSLPGGRSNPQVINACLEAGYTHIYTSTPKSESLPLDSTVGRLNILRNMTLDQISAILATNGTALPKLHFLSRIKTAAQSLMGDALYEKLWAISNRKETDPIPAEAAENEDPAHHQ
jgi:peptidoglycan/xylan/chitin deacetylase (PgdA/CDA1 family)